MKSHSKAKTTLKLIVLLGAIIATFYLNQKPSSFTGFAVQDNNAYNIKIDLPNNYLSVAPGGEIWFTMNTLNLASSSRKDITLSYKILSKENIPIATKKETVAMETQASFVGSLKIPQSTPPGDYILTAELFEGSQNNSAALTEQMFKVEIKKQSNSKILIAFLVSIFGVVLIWIEMNGKKILAKYKIRKKVKSIVEKRKKKLSEGKG